MKKGYIALIICLILYLIIMFVVFKGDPKQKQKEKIEEYVLFSNNQVWKYDGSKFLTVANNIEALTNQKFYIYEDGAYKGKYKLGTYENSLYLFDDDNNSINYNGELIGFTDNNKHIVSPTISQTIDIKDQEIIKQFFDNNHLEYQNINYENVQKYISDIDNDDKLETLYNISNMFDENKIGKGYSLIFINDDDKIYELIKDIETNNKSFSEGYGYYVNNIVDLDNDKIMDFIVTKSKYGSPDICYMLIQKQKKEYKITKSC